MTDKNQAALDALNWMADAANSSGHTTTGAVEERYDTIRAALQSLTATSAGVDVSRVALDKIIGTVVRIQAILPEGISGWGTFTDIKEIAKEALTAIPDMREAWLPIESAPRDGTVFLGLSKFYKDPFVTYWGSAAQERGDIPALPEGSSIQQHWVLANSEDGSVLYEPDFWMPLKCSEPPKGEKS